MRHETNKLDFKTSAANGNAMDIREMEQVAVFVGSEGSAPVDVTGKLQGTVHGLSQWFDIQTYTNTDFTNGRRVEVGPGYTKIRMVTSTYTSGEIVAIASGKNTRTD